MEGGMYSGKHIQWAGGHAAGLGLHLVAGAGTVRHMTGQEEDGERQWGWSTHGVTWVRGSVLLGESQWYATGQGT